LDQRDTQTWIALELNRTGEQKVEDGTLESSLRSDLGVDPSFPIFIPATTYTKNNRTITLYLVEGYAFVGSGLPEVRYFALERKSYVHQVVFTKSGPHKLRVPSVIPNSHIEEMRQRLRKLVSSDIEIGATVKVTDGPYKALEGLVLDTEADQAIVQVRLRSIDLILTIPLVFLDAQMTD
jgi:transcription antitermination factor NusG